jgi:hypothetical protein
MENKNIYLIPANSKKSMLILSLFNPVDLIVLCSGIGITFLLLLVFNSVQETWFKVVCALPALTALTLVAPLPYYHNVRTLLGNIIRYFSSRRNYFWRGWCVKDEFRKSER